MRKILNGVYIDLTPEEIAEYEAQQPAIPTITPEERIVEAEAKIAAAQAEIESAKNELLGIIDTMEVGG